VDPYYVRRLDEPGHIRGGVRHSICHGHLLTSDLVRDTRTQTNSTIFLFVIQAQLHFGLTDGGPFPENLQIFFKFFFYRLKSRSHDAAQKDAPTASRDDSAQSLHPRSAKA
jgi:hypothetical protein